MGFRRAAASRAVVRLAAPALLLASFAMPGATEPASPPARAAAFPDAAPLHHDATREGCDACHAPHAGRGPDDRAFRRGGEPETAGAGLHVGPSMLRGRGPLAMCLSCHDGRPGVPDVVAEDVNALAQRAAGHFARPGVPNPNGHDLAFARDLDRGEAASQAAAETRAVTCTDCHDPHGNGIARNLRRPDARADTPPLGLFVDPSARGLERYESRRIAYGAIDAGVLEEASRPCLDCHSGMGGRAPEKGAAGASRHRLHPSWEEQRGLRPVIAGGDERGVTRADHWEAGIGAGFEGVPRVRVVVRDASGFRAASRVSAATGGVFCLTCHLAHGSDQPYGLAWNPFAGAGGTGCEQCHAVSGETAPAPVASHGGN